MYSRFIILITLLFFRVFFTPVWYSFNINHLTNPAGTFEHIRVHKRRSGFTDDISVTEAMLAESQQEEQKLLRQVLRLIKRLLFPDITKEETLSCFHSTADTSPLFLRHCVLRI
jgi:hypothetical protein